jgi:uncharacterized protein with von Willebrand factor type A (vWA) domain
MGKIRVKQPPLANQIQRLRRQQNASDNQALFLRVFAKQDYIQRQQQLQQKQQEERIPEEMMDNPYDYSPEDHNANSSSSSCTEENAEWVTLEPEPPRPIDVAIEACKEQYRREARYYKWDAVTREIHSHFMIMKAQTKNFTTQLNYNPMLVCTCPPRPDPYQNH